MPFYERLPYIQPLHRIITEVMVGEIRVPRFQRPDDEWEREQRGDLLDSIYRDFPIGTIMLWATSLPISTFQEVGTFRIPAHKEVGASVARLLLDGHQRLSALVRILGPGLLADIAQSGITVERAFIQEEEVEEWFFELDSTIVKEESQSRFFLPKKGQKITPTQLPLSNVLNRSALNRWIRENKDLTEQQIKEADNLRDRLREYAIPVAVLNVDSLEEATESFKRINSSGTPMNDFNMWAALVYKDDFDPQELFGRFRAEILEPLGHWKDIDDQDILRVYAALQGEHPTKINIKELANIFAESKKQNTIENKNPIQKIERAFMAIRDATEILALCGVHGPRALPYSWQMITLAIRLGGDSPVKANVDPTAQKSMIRWFWLTTYGEVFGGIKSSIFDRAKKALDAMLKEEGNWAVMERDITRKVLPVQRFDYRAARSKACALAMARLQDEGNTDGPAHKALAVGVESLGLLMPSGKRSIWWHLAVVSDPEQVGSWRDALKQRERNSDDKDLAVLDKLGIPKSASGDIVDLLQARRDLLLAEEKTFVEALGLEWSDQ